MSYVAGMRDAMDLVLRAMAAQAPAPTVQADATAHSWALELIGIGAGYSKATGKDVRIAVLDTGIDLDHPDFAALVGTRLETASFIPNQSVQDGHGHGTHCAGIIAASPPGKSARRYSVAPDAYLLIGKVLADDGFGHDDQILEAIDWATDAGARIISMSLGSARGVNEPFSDPYETVAANLLAMNPGVLLVAAAGNESQRPSYTRPVGNPAACPSILAVSALDQGRGVYERACRGMDSVGAVDMAAPGVSVYSAWTGKGFRTISGTSMATPHVAGVAALCLELDKNLTARQLWNKLKAHCVQVGTSEDFGAGLVQAP